ECGIHVEPSLAHIGDDADHFAGRIVLSLPQNDRPADRVSSRPQQIGDALADHRAPRFADLVPLVEVPAGEERQTHRLEVTSRDDAPRAPGNLRAGVGLIGSGKPESGAAARQRASTHRGGRYDVRYLLNTIEQRAIQLTNAWCAVPRG